MGLIIDSNNADVFLRLNIGGTHFLIRNETVLNRKTGLLSLIVRWPHEKRIPLADAYLENTKEYYFERSASLFNVIYQFYLTGSIHLPENLCLKDVLNELDYWCIAPDKYLAECCCFGINTDQLDLIKSNPEMDQVNHFKHLRFGEYRLQIWNLIEVPSRSGRFVNHCVENSSDFHVVETEPLPIFERLEFICIVWFIFEYVLKMAVSYDRLKTFFQLLNIIDLLAILPFTIEIALSLFEFNTRNMRDLK
ncbi:unnamed protein product, partial [Onchocerca flexuosa]|uniref:BTB domain-containing protein n=1 Tax=Onchocerca flexuosa TaxID=387005 RepID=A0A183H8A3_9BILA